MNRRPIAAFALLVGLAAAFTIAAILVLAPGIASSATPCRVGVRVSGQTYYGFVTRSYRTSCPFARNVARASLRRIVHAGGAGDGDFYVIAYSPVTQAAYKVHCLANGDIYSAYGVRVTCRAGLGALIRYRAWS